MRYRRFYAGLALAVLICGMGVWIVDVERGDLAVDDREPKSPYPIYTLDKWNKEEFLPSSYDYRGESRAPEIQNQGNYGTCWAFASLSALESTLMPEETLVLSRDHMSLQNGFNLEQDEGGDYTMSMAYLLGWQGPVLDRDDPYGDGYSPPGLEPVLHVQGIQIIPGKDYKKLKAAVYLMGGVQSSLFTSIKDHKSRSVYYNESTHSYYYVGEENPNHDVVIVGWDDDYPRENFNMEPEGDGAFLCASSWGTGFGDGGYFYVSYYDTNIGKHNIVYKDVESADNYDHIYQADLCGWVGQMGYGREYAYGANVYRTKGRERLDAVGFYATDVNTEYEVYVSRHVGENPDFAKRRQVAAGKLLNSGFYTVKLDQPEELDEGERFAVIVKIMTPGAVHPIAIEYAADDARSLADLSDGEGYISSRGETWESAEEKYNCNLCLKAYTVNLKENS